MVTSTPVRALGTLAEGGYRILADLENPPTPTATQQHVLDVLDAASDLSSTSQELADHAVDWPSRYALTPVRANALRALDVPADARVLELDCGCGPVTRYLGETAALVDALAATSGEAQVAHRRTQDLDTVQVLVGTLEDVPAEPTYDVVVALGVLERVGGGTADAEPYRRFLEQVGRVLADGGTLVLGVENPLGVKYLVGAPDPFTDTPFDSVEGYPILPPARALSRAAVTSALRETGYRSRVLSAFPDSTIPRAVLADEVFDRAPELAARIPPLPSADYGTPRHALADERLVWRSLVDAGVGPAFANSCLVLAQRQDAAPLWPDGRLATVFSAERQPEYMVRADLEAEDEGVAFRRTPLTHRPDVVERDGVRHVIQPRAPYAQGRPLADLALADPDAAPDLLRRWADLVPDDEWAPVDLVPHNVLVQADGRFVVIDQEWFVRGFGRANTLLRGIFWSAVQAVHSPHEDRLRTRTVQDMVETLGAYLDLDVGRAALERFFAVEASFQAVVNATDGAPADRRARALEELRGALGYSASLDRASRRVLDELKHARLEVRRLPAMAEERKILRLEILRLGAQIDELHRREEQRVGTRLRRRLGLDGRDA